MVRTVFSMLPIGQKFVFLGNPIVFEKTTDFEAQVWDSPYELHDETISASAITGSFKVDSMVDTYGAIK
jgi:hypothetical protein